MSDFISRSALIKKLREKSVKDEVNTLSTTYTYKELVNIICNLPTSFDIKKVVAELEKEKEIHTEHYNISLYKDYPEIKQRYEQIQGVIDKTIDIVRKGGAV